MAIGLGIHGEPGIDETGIPTADGLAELLVARLLDELPEGVETPRGARVVPILNGLGSLKYEEMFVIYRRIAELLADAGAIVVDPHVGEYCTSFDMAGTSLTLFWLGGDTDTELAELWDAPVDTPAYRRGSVVAAAHDDTAAAVEATAAVPPASDASREAARLAARAVAITADTIDAHVDELGRLDQIAGDGDQGSACSAAHSPPAQPPRARPSAARAPAPSSSTPATPGRTGRRHVRRTLGRHPPLDRRDHRR
jgi:dihydroxyacetone kinase